MYQIDKLIEANNRASYLYMSASNKAYYNQAITDAIKKIEGTELHPKIIKMISERVFKLKK